MRLSRLFLVFALGCGGKGELSSADEDLSGKFPIVFMVGRDPVKNCRQIRTRLGIS